MSWAIKEDLFFLFLSLSLFLTRFFSLSLLFFFRDFPYSKMAFRFYCSCEHNWSIYESASPLLTKIYAMQMLYLKETQ